MKKFLFFILILFFTSSVLARGFGYHGFRSYRPKSYVPKIPHITSNSGGTHYVRPYTKRDGTIVQGHLSDNPNSGVHCHNNICN